MKLFYTTTALATLLFFTPITAQAKMGSNDPEALIKEGEFFGELRYRYENVDQAGFADDANANTMRANFGFKTGLYNGFQGLMEAQFVNAFGNDHFNSTTNGQTGYPTVADPDNEEINQAWISYSGISDTTVKLGRQKMNIDNQRFIGTVNWRQNDQTFDAIQLTNSSIENLSLQYAYIDNVNRIFGDDADLGDLESSNHIMNASYKFADWARVSAYGYLLEFDRLAAKSSDTYGVRATGDMPINDNWGFFYEAEYATQTDAGNNTNNYDENYYHIAPGIKAGGFSFKTGYEVLGGDGTNAFQTPLATLHKFNGWADVFLNTPDEGLEDMYVSASYKLSDTNTFMDGVKFTAVYHDFDSDASSVGDFGEELDLSIGKTFKLKDRGAFDSLNVLFKYADYDGETSGGVDADRQKIWFQMGVKF